MAIKKEIITSLKKAISRKDNWHKDGTVNWNYVESDLFCDLDHEYSDDELIDSLNIFADMFERRK